MMNEIHVMIDDNIKTIASEHAEERLKYEFNRFGLSNEIRKSMILIGSIGQLIFKKFLEDNHVDFNFEFQAGDYDKMDFEVKGKKIEIKCSGFDDTFDHMNLLYAKDQLYTGIEKRFEYCVQIFINGYNKSSKMLNINKCNESIIFGFTEFENIKNFKNLYPKYYADHYKMPLNELKPIGQLIEILK